MDKDKQQRYKTMELPNLKYWQFSDGRIKGIQAWTLYVGDVCVNGIQAWFAQGTSPVGWHFPSINFYTQSHDSLWGHSVISFRRNTEICLSRIDL